MHIDALIVGPFESVCYLIWGAERRVLVLDPGADPEAIRARLDAHRVELAGCLLTHGHVDHVSALSALLEGGSAFWAIHPRDLAWTFSASNRLPPYYETPRRPASAPRLLEDGQAAAEAGLAFRVLWTPGHSPGGVCFYFPEAGALFSGDTLFRGTVGRTDLPAGDGRQLAASLRKLAVLPPATRIYPGHGPATTLDDEFRGNPFLKRPAPGRG